MKLLHEVTEVMFLKKCSSLKLLFSGSVLSNSLWPPWTVAHQAFLSLTIFWSLLKFVSIELVMPSNHLMSVVPFSSCPQSFPAAGSFLLSQLFASGGQSTGASASASVVMNIQGWFPLGFTGLISFPRVFFSTTIWKHQFFSTQPSLLSNSHIRTWLLEKP